MKPPTMPRASCKWCVDCRTSKKAWDPKRCKACNIACCPHVIRPDGVCWPCWRLKEKAA